MNLIGIAAAIDEQAVPVQMLEQRAGQCVIAQRVSLCGGSAGQQGGAH